LKPTTSFELVGIFTLSHFISGQPSSFDGFFVNFQTQFYFKKLHLCGSHFHTDFTKLIIFTYPMTVHEFKDLHLFNQKDYQFSSILTGLKHLAVQLELL